VFATLPSADAGSRKGRPGAVEGMTGKGPADRQPRRYLPKLGRDPRANARGVIRGIVAGNPDARLVQHEDDGHIAIYLAAELLVLCSSCTREDSRARARVQRAGAVRSGVALPACPRRPARRMSAMEDGYAEFVDMLGDPDPEVRMAACWRLAELGSNATGAIPALRQTLNDADTEVVFCAAHALRRIRSSSADEFFVEELKRWDLARTGRGSEAAEVRVAIVRLAEALKSPSREGRFLAAWNLKELFGTMRDAACAVAVPQLRVAVSDEDPKIRLLSCQALGVLGRDAAEAWPELTKARHDEDERVSAMARWASRWAWSTELRLSRSLLLNVLLLAALLVLALVR
jgi:hypothetical protein